MFDLVGFIKAAGYLGIFAVVFSESGLLVGAVLPGDSLLFTAGFLASQQYLNILPLVSVAFLGAVLGDGVGYWMGRKFGPRVFTKEDSLFFSKDHVARAEGFYERYGGWAIVLARFVPVVRTLAPIIAGVGRMHYPAFLFYNVIGGVLWAIGVPLVGYYLGRAVPNADRYLLPIVALIIFLSVLPGITHFLKYPENRRKISQFLRKNIFRTS
ncbi:MAG: DedA family protein [Candidatus Sungbacteria bacterium]|uniref:DedA family protein n=1 Tax=Candidatus Sungiibacteriota bacterium TaxID=2750080 RepID=A0A931SDN4_9BACT|nr:DedA family protein [Candidatus Sungbacteria bacterium]